MDSGRVPSIGTVFEADGERDAGSEFAMELTFGCAGSDGTPGKHCQGKRVGECRGDGQRKDARSDRYWGCRAGYVRIRTRRRDSTYRCGIEKLLGYRDGEGSDIDEKLPRDAKTLVYFEGAVDIGIVDETLPSDGCAWFFKVGAHDDEEVFAEGDFCLESFSVFEGLFGGVDGAWADDDEETVVVACDDSSGRVACGCGCFLRGQACDDFVTKKGRLY